MTHYSSAWVPSLLCDVRDHGEPMLFAIVEDCVPSVGHAKTGIVHRMNVRRIPMAIWTFAAILPVVGVAPYSTASAAVHRAISGHAALLPTFVALGDSYSSGEGNPGPTTTRWVDTNGVPTGPPYSRLHNCDRSAIAYPMIVNSWLKTVVGAPAMGFHFYACSGATTGDLWPSGAQRGTPQEPLQLSNTAALLNARIVTLTVGGDDLNFTDVLTNCTLGLHTPHSCSSSSNDGWIADLHANILKLRSTLVATYQRVLADAPNATLFVVGYPDLFPPQPSTLQQNVTCPKVTSILPRGIGYLSYNEQALNNVIQSAVAQVPGVTFVDPNVSGPNSFLGHSVCAKNSWFNGIRFVGLSRLLDASYSFHPNAAGQSHLAALVEAAITSSQVLKTVAHVVPLGSPTISGAADVPMGSTVSGSTLTDQAILTNVSSGDATPFNWNSAEYWRVNVTSQNPLTFTYRVNTDSGGPIIQLMDPGTTDASASNANGIDFGGSPSGFNIGVPGTYQFSLPLGNYVFALGIGNSHGSPGAYSFSFTNSPLALPILAVSSASPNPATAQPIASGDTVEGNVLTDTAAVTSQNTLSAPSGWISGEYWLVHVAPGVPLQVGYTNCKLVGGPTLAVFSLANAASGTAPVTPNSFVDVNGAVDGATFSNQGWYKFSLPAGTYVLVVGVAPDSGSNGYFAFTLKD